MGILDVFSTRSSANPDGSVFQNILNSFLRGDDIQDIRPTSSGVHVNQDSAMSLTAVYSCVRIIAWALASLPLHTYKEAERGKEKAKDFYLYKILHDTPNPEMTSFRWRELTYSHLNLWGAGISEIEFDQFGLPVYLWPIPPWRVEPVRVRETKELVYRVRLEDNSYKILRKWQVVVFPALSTSLDNWMSPIGVHRETVGSAIAVKQFGAKTFGQGTNPAGIITHPGKFKETSEQSLRDKFAGYTGLGNSHRLMLLEDGVKFDRIGLPPEDAQYLQTRQFDISEFARIYNIPLHLLQSHEKSTSWGSGLEELNGALVTYTLTPYIVMSEQEIKKKLIFDDTHYAKFQTAGLLRGNIKDRYESYNIARNNGILSANEWREMEDMNRLEGEEGDIYLIPLNMQNAKFASKKPDEGGNNDAEEE